MGNAAKHCPRWRSVAQGGTMLPKVAQCCPKWRSFGKGASRLAETGQNVLGFI